MNPRGQDQRRKFWIVPIVVALLLFLAWLAFRERSKAAELQATNTQLLKSHDRDVDELAALRVKLAAARKEKDDLVATVAAEKKAVPAAPAAKPATTNVDITEYFEADPEFPAYREKLIQERIRLRYGDLRSLNLSPEKLQRLQHLLYDQASAPQDARAAALKLGMTPGSPEMNRATAAAMKEIDSEIKALLGTSGFDNLQAAQHQTQSAFGELQAAQRQTQNITNLQNGIGLKMTLAGAAFSGEQITALSETLSHFQSGGTMTMALPPEQEESLQASVAQILTPSQLEIFKQDRAMRLLEDKLRWRSLESAKKALGHDINSWSLRGP